MRKNIKRMQELYMVKVQYIKFLKILINTSVKSFKNIQINILILLITMIIKKY